MCSDILELLRNEEMRVKMAQAGWQRVQKLTWENQSRELANTYNRWLKAWDFKTGKFIEKELRA